MMFAAVAVLAALSPLGAQQLPARDLFQFPVGTLAEAPALASAAGGGFWNPATIGLRSAGRTQAAVTALSAPIEQGVFALLASASRELRPGLTGGVGVAQASVSDLLRTDTDPLTLGSIPYHTTVLSAELAAARGPAVIGVALRRRSAVVDIVSGSATSLDIGGVVTRPAGLPLRAALSSFLLSPSRGIERASILGAIEGYLPVIAYDLRSGVSWQHDEGGGDEGYVYASGRTSLIELRGGLARRSAFGTTTTRLRLGVGLRYARYLVGVAREDGTAGLGASYQFLLTTAFP